MDLTLVKVLPVINKKNLYQFQYKVNKDQFYFSERFCFTIAALILVWWFPLPKGLYLDLFKVSFIGSTLQYGLTYTGLNIIDASSAVLLVQLEVPFGIIIAFFLLKEIPSIKNIVGLEILEEKKNFLE